jgi:hypothetical protein
MTKLFPGTLPVFLRHCTDTGWLVFLVRCKWVSTFLKGKFIVIGIGRFLAVFRKRGLVRLGRGIFLERRWLELGGTLGL